MNGRSSIKPIGPPAELRERDRGPGRRWLVGRAAVFVVNLPVPVWFGCAVTDSGGKLGMAAGVVVLAVLWGALCRRRGRVGDAFVVGGIVVATSQALPILHIYAGLLGIAVGSDVGMIDARGADFGRVAGPAVGFLVTMVTGMLLMSAALAIALFFQLLTPGVWWGQRTKPQAGIDRDLLD